MSDKLEDFPDGGRATLVRHYSPALTRRQLDTLGLCPYEMPKYLGTDHPQHRHALALVRYGLLERNPESRNIFRVTEAGAAVVLRWQAAGFKVT